METPVTILVRLGLTAVLAALIKGIVAWSGHSIHWGWAAVISLVLVFGGWLILDSDVID